MHQVTCFLKPFFVQQTGQNNFAENSTTHCVCTITRTCTMSNSNLMASSHFTWFSPDFHLPTGFVKLPTNAQNRRQIGAHHSVNY